jgi:hypothetical protein
VRQTDPTPDAFQDTTHPTIRRDVTKAAGEHQGVGVGFLVAFDDVQDGNACGTEGDFMVVPIRILAHFGPDLGDGPQPFHEVDLFLSARDKCGRRGQYGIEQLLEQYGPDIAMPDLRHELAQCPHRRDMSNPCQVKYASAAASISEGWCCLNLGFPRQSP